MKVYTHSVGNLPFWSWQITFIGSVIFLAVLYVHARHYGPSVEVRGLAAPTDLPLHINSPEYAIGVARRFAREYLNWSHQGHLVAKRRASWLCSSTMRSEVMSGALQKEPYYHQLRMVSNAELGESTITWQNRSDGRYQVEMICQVSEWQGHIESQYPMKAIVQLQPRYATDNAATIALEVSAYNFQTLSDPKTVESEALTAVSTAEDEAIAAASSGDRSPDALTPTELPAQLPARPTTAKPEDTK